MNDKVLKDFCVQEFVNPEFYKKKGNKAIWWIDERIPVLCQNIRDHFKSAVIINNWHLGGKFKERGLRNFDSKIGEEYSFHKFGKAVDISVFVYEPKEVIDYIRNNFLKVNGVGVHETFLHLDFGNRIAEWEG